MTTFARPTRSSHPRHPERARHEHGWTLIELLIGMAVVVVVTSLAVPAYLGHVRKLRRADAMAAVLQIQQAQERWRMNQPTYAATLGSAGLNLPNRSAGGHYQLDTSTEELSAATAYTISATGIGLQTGDTPCRYLRISVRAGEIVHLSGPDDQFGNDDAANRRCWNE